MKPAPLLLTRERACLSSGCVFEFLATLRYVSRLFISIVAKLHVAIYTHIPAELGLASRMLIRVS